MRISTGNGRRSQRLAGLTLLIFLTHIMPAACAAEADLILPEYKVYASWLYNFTKLCAWPANTFGPTNAPLTICVLGEDPFGHVLDETIKGHTIGGRPLAVHRCHRLQEIKECHLLFISRSERERMPEILARLPAESILTVGDTEEFIQAGGMIRLVKGRDGIRFEICRGAATRHGLVLSSKLLALARIVCPAGREESR